MGRLFSVVAFPYSAAFEVQTIAGSPAAPLGDSCGYADGFPQRPP